MRLTSSSRGSSRPGYSRAPRTVLVATTIAPVAPSGFAGASNETNQVSPAASFAVKPAAYPRSSRGSRSTTRDPAPCRCRALDQFVVGQRTAPMRLVNQLESGTSSMVLMFCARTPSGSCGGDEQVVAEVVEQVDLPRGRAGRVLRSPVRAAGDRPEKNRGWAPCTWAISRPAVTASPAPAARSHDRRAIKWRVIGWSSESGGWRQTPGQSLRCRAQVRCGPASRTVHEGETQSRSCSSAHPG